MKTLSLIMLAAASLFAPRRLGFSTSNAQSDDIAALKARADEQEALIAKLTAQLAEKAAPAPADEASGTIALLAKGAGVPLEDVTWRVKAGLDPEQAVEAAIGQKAENDRRAAKKAA